MSGARSSYLEELAEIQERIHRLFERALLSPGFERRTTRPGTWAPQVDLVETDQAFLAQVELPGVVREDVTLEVDGGRLVLAGHRRRLPGADRFLQMERSYGDFRRSFDLPESVASEGITARLERGVLHVTLPKRGADTDE